VRCNVGNWTAKATTLALNIDAGGRPIKQYELCAVQAEHVAERERARRRKIINREVNH